MAEIPEIVLGQKFIEKDPPPGRILLCAITGSHYYGFASKDSDIDLKGVHIVSTEDLLGLRSPVEGFDRLEVFQKVEYDLTTNEIRQALYLLLRGNGNMLERIMSPFQIYQTQELLELQDLAKQSLSQCFYGHYLGFFRGICREHEKAREPKVKKLLYAYRVALTGIHLLRTGELEANLEKLSSQYQFPRVKELIEFKQEKQEKSLIPKEVDNYHRDTWPRLFNMLEIAKKESSLPSLPPNREAIENWLIALRRRELS